MLRGSTRVPLGLSLVGPRVVASPARRAAERSRGRRDRPRASARASRRCTRLRRRRRATTSWPRRDRKVRRSRTAPVCTRQDAARRDRRSARRTAPGPRAGAARRKTASRCQRTRWPSTRMSESAGLTVSGRSVRVDAALPPSTSTGTSTRVAHVHDLTRVEVDRDHDTFDRSVVRIVRLLGIERRERGRAVEGEAAHQARVLPVGQLERPRRREAACRPLPSHRCRCARGRRRALASRAAMARTRARVRWPPRTRPR